MIQCETIQEYLRRAFAPTPRGIVGLTDQMLECFVGSEVEFKRVGDQCVCRWTGAGVNQEATVPLPLAAFRTILARIAALCNEHSPNSVTPYGGTGLLAVKCSPLKVIRVAFINTANEQKLELRPTATRGSDEDGPAAEHNGENKTSGVPTQICK